jgi:putative transposase
MRGKRFAEEQIIKILKEAESGIDVKTLVRTYGISEVTFYKWKRKFGGLEVSDAKKMRALEEENRRLKKIVADQLLENQVIKELLSKNF